MNTQPQDDRPWQALLAHSAPTFTGDTTPPFGFVTSTLARLRAEKDKELFERIGLRALFGSLAMLVAVGGLTLGIHLQDHIGFDPSLKNIIQADDSPIA